MSFAKCESQLQLILIVRLVLVIQTFDVIDVVIICIISNFNQIKLILTI